MSSHVINLKKRFKQSMEIDKTISRDHIEEDFVSEKHLEERLRKLGTQKVLQDLETLKERVTFLHNRGFDLHDTWSLDSSLARWAAPRLKHLKVTKCGYPGIDEAATDKAWNKVLDKMIKAFELVSDESIAFMNKKQKKQCEEGLDLFRKYFRDLWD